MRTPGAPAPFLLLSIRPEDEAADDEYAAMLRFSRLTESGLVRVRLDRESLGPVSLDEWSGIILGGGPYNFSDPQPDKPVDQRRAETELFALLDKVIARDFPFLGCCYGIGVIGSYIGATVDRQFSEPVGAVPISLTSAGRDDELFAELPAMFEAFVGHKEAISKLPANAVVLAASPSCPVQAFRVRRNIYATQFHPELDAAGIRTRIDVYKHYGYYPPETAEVLKAEMVKVDAVHPRAILRTFAKRYAQLS